MSKVFKCEAALLDMDGTLLDSTASIRAAWSAFAERHYLPTDVVEAALPGRTGEEIIVDLLGDQEVDVSAELFEIRRVEQDMCDTVAALPGALQLVDSLPQNRWALVTAAPRELMVQRMNSAGIPVPKITICSGDVLRGKPSPEGFIAAANALGVNPEECVVFEDSNAGLKAAERAGAIPISIGELGAIDAHLHVPDLSYVSATYADDELRICLS